MKNIFFIICALALPLAAKEYVFNRDFSLPDIGYAMQRSIDITTQKDWSFHPEEFRKEGDLTFVRINNLNGQFFGLHSHEYNLEKGKKYQITIRARSSVENYPVSLINLGTLNRRWFVNGPTVKLSKVWKNYTYNFIPKETAYYHILISQGNNRKVPSGFIDIALISVTDHAAGKKDIDCGVQPEKTVFFTNDPVKIGFSVIIKNHAGGPVSDKITIRAVDDYYKTTIFEKIFHVELKAHECKKLYFSETVSRYGAYHFEFSGPARSYGKSFCIMGKYQPRKIRIPGDFCIGGNYGTNIRLQQNGTPRLTMQNCEKEDEIALMARSGIRVIREHDGGVSTTCWTVTEPEPGKFNFRYGDWSMKLYEKYGLVAMPVFGNCAFVRPFDNLRWALQPEWLLKTSPLSSWDRGWCKNQVLAISHTFWRRYIRACAEHFRGRIKICEIVNEPNLLMIPDDYAKYLKIASDEIRKASPQTHINGIGISWDHGAEDLHSWSKVIKKTKMLDMVDSIGFHPYSTPHLGSPYPADRLIGEMHAMIKELGKPDLPIWDSECYYLSGDTKAPDKNVFPAHYAAWRYLTDLGEGIQLSTPINLGKIWHGSVAPGFCNRIEIQPGAVCNAFNRIAILLEGAKTVSKRYLNSSTILYRYKTFEGKDIVAVWNFGHVKNIYADLSGFKVLDMFGNPLPAENLNHLEITEAPYYILPDKKSFDPELEKIVLAMDNPLMVSPQIRQINDNLYISFFNDSNRDIKGYAGFLGYQNVSVTPFEAMHKKDGLIALHVKNETLQPGIKKEIRLFFDGKNFNIPVQVVKSRVLQTGKKYTFCSQDKKATCTILCQKIKGKIMFSIYVKDSTNGGPMGRRHMWDCDAVELFLDTQPTQANVKHPEQYDSHVSRFFFLPREKGERQFVLWSQELKRKDVDYTINESPDGYSVKLSIPEKIFNGKLFGFDCKVDDSESPGKTAKRELRLGTYPEPFKNRMAFCIFLID